MRLTPKPALPKRRQTPDKKSKHVIFQAEMQRSAYFNVERHFTGIAGHKCFKRRASASVYKFIISTKSV